MLLFKQTFNNFNDPMTNSGTIAHCLKTVSLFNYFFSIPTCFSGCALYVTKTCIIPRQIPRNLLISEGPHGGFLFLCPGHGAWVAPDSTEELG